MMKFPDHKAGLILSHNQHLGVYRTVAERIADGRFAEHEWVSEEQKQKAVATNEVWELQWYPHTPVGFCTLRGADLEAVLAEANHSQMAPTGRTT